MRAELCGARKFVLVTEHGRQATGDGAAGVGLANQIAWYGVGFDRSVQPTHNLLVSVAVADERAISKPVGRCRPKERLGSELSRTFDSRPQQVDRISHGRRAQIAWGILP